jgi:hypothetical protein
MLALILLLPVLMAYSHHSSWVGSYTVPSLGLLILSATVLLWEQLPQCVSATGSLQSLSQTSPLRVGQAFSLQLDGWPWNPPTTSGGPSSHTTTTLSHQATATLMLLCIQGVERGRVPGPCHGTSSSPSHSMWCLKSKHTS